MTPLALAIVLVHNKSDQENIDQIDAARSLVNEIAEIQFQEDTGEQVPKYRYVLKGAGEEVEVKFFQVVPFGVTPPTNLYSIRSPKVFYGKGDEDKTGSHPRFFNWGVKRATSSGADITLYLEDAKTITPGRIRAEIAKTTNGGDFVDAVFGKIASKRLSRVGELREDMVLPDAVSEYKERLTGRGIRHG